jgi:tetratricopeptide (TPR) repeat protein
MNSSEVKKTAIANYLPWLFLVLLMIVAVFVYKPGLSGPLVLDDVSNIQNNPALDIENPGFGELKKAAFSYVAMEGRQPLTMLSFAVERYYLGDDVYSAKVINLAIHIVNGILVFLLVKLLVQLVLETRKNGDGIFLPGWFAIIIATAWLLHPVNLTVVLYVMQRATSLSALFVLMSLLAYTKGRISWSKSKKRRATVWFSSAFIFSIGGFLSKETALLLPLYLFLLDWLVLTPFFHSRNSRKAPGIAVFVWLAIGLILGGGYIAWGGGWDSFGSQSLTPMQVLLTEPRALLFYLGLILLPRPSDFGLFHDDIAISTGVFSPVSTVIAFCVLIILLWSAMRVRHQHKLLSFGGFFFLVSLFVGPILMPSELFQDHGSYLGSVGALLAVTALFLGVRSLFLSPATRMLIVACFCIFFGAMTHGQVQGWQSQNRLAMTMLNNHPLSAKSNYQAALVYAEMSLDPAIARDNRDEFKQLSVDYFIKSSELKPDDASGLLAVLLIEGLERKASKKNMIDDLLSGKKSNAVPLVVDQDAVLDIPRRLEEKPPSKLAIQNLLRISKCERSGGCLYNRGRIDQLFEKLMLNPDVGQRLNQKAVLFDEMALRKFVDGDYPAALELVNKAISINPKGAIFKLNAAVILASSNEVGQALIYINEVLSEPQSKAVRKRAQTMLETLERGEKSR